MQLHGLEITVIGSMPPDSVDMQKPDQIVSLDVGGHIYTTTLG